MLELKQSLNLKLQQQLVMTPQLQQAIRLLQLSRLELVSAIQAELEQNPALEEDLRQDVEALEQEAAIAGEEPHTHELAETERPKEVTGDQDNANDIDWQQWLDSYNSSAPMSSGPRDLGEDLPSIEQTLTRPESLFDHLEAQIQLLPLVEADRRIAIEIIGALNDEGFLVDERPLEEIAIRLGLSVDHVLRVLEEVQRLDPPGIAARDIHECLLIQLRQRPERNLLAERIVTDHLVELEKRNFSAIAKHEDVTVEDVSEALRIIQSLEPRPARNFGGSDSVYITPDIYVEKVGDTFVVLLNEDGLPMLRVSKYYRAALANGMNGEAKAYVQEKLRSAQWLIRSIHQRQRTICRVMESILKFQAEFFDKGISGLKPLILRDIAEDIEMHESTISRVTSNKYVHTPQGIFELKYFFNSSIARSEGDDMASEAVKHRIRRIVESEDAKKPYSDLAIAAVLKKDNIDIARRTVAKYREAMGILASSRRKRVVPK
jgi:RNA polymerase sigma-54 factor